MNIGRYVTSLVQTLQMELIECLSRLFLPLSLGTYVAISTITPARQLLVRNLTGGGGSKDIWQARFYTD